MAGHSSLRRKLGGSRPPRTLGAGQAPGDRPIVEPGEQSALARWRGPHEYVDGLARQRRDDDHGRKRPGQVIKRITDRMGVSNQNAGQPRDDREQKNYEYACEKLMSIIRNVLIPDQKAGEIAIATA